MMTRTLINNIVWIASLILQCALLVLVFSRHIARRLPVFTLLLVFYPVRSMLLFGLFGHLAPATYSEAYNDLSLTDVFLQLLVAVEIALHLLRAAGGWTWRRALMLLLCPCLAWTATLLYAKVLPSNTPIPPDRLQIFDSFVMILLCAGVFIRPAPTLLRRIIIGFAFYGVFSLFTTSVRTFAAMHRDARTFALGSYMLSAAYLLVVLYWILLLKRRPVHLPLAMDTAARHG